MFSQESVSVPKAAYSLGHCLRRLRVLDSPPHSRLAIGQVKRGLLFGFAAGGYSALKAAVHKVEPSRVSLG